MWRAPCARVCPAGGVGGPGHLNIVAGRFAQSLRLHLWREHLGLLDPSPLARSLEPHAAFSAGAAGAAARAREAMEAAILDPVCDATYFDVWMRTALANTLYFEAK